MVRLNPLAARYLDSKIVQLQVLPHLQLVAAFDAKQKLEQPFIEPYDMAEAKLPKAGISLEKLPVRLGGAPHADDFATYLPTHKVEFLRG